MSTLDVFILYKCHMLSDVRVWSMGYRGRSKKAWGALTGRKKLSWSQGKRAHMSAVPILEIQ